MWIKISCPRIHFLICKSALSLPFIKIFIGLLKKYILHKQVEYALHKSAYCWWSSFFSLWCLVSHVFLYTHLYQPDPQHNHNTAQFDRGTVCNTTIYFRNAKDSSYTLGYISSYSFWVSISSFNLYQYQ